MQYLSIIQESLDYIEENLKASISAEELSRKAGFSLFHYYRLFQRAVGVPVVEYITKRRLLWAMYEISMGSTQIDAALRYGFDTSAGFYKAFRREFGCSPSEYTKRYPVRKPFRICLEKEDHPMISKKRAAQIISRWNMQELPIQTVVLDSGYVSESTFQVGENHFLKAYTVAGRAQNNAAILTALNRAKLTAAPPIPTADGEVFASDGEFTYLLTEKVPGKAVQVQELFGPEGEEKARYLGQVIGRLHAVLKENDGIVCNERNIFEEVRDHWLAPAREAMDLPEAFCRDYLGIFGMLHPQLPVQIIHRDPNPHNILLDNGVISGFIDFDLSQRSIRLFDPCYAATGILSECGAFTTEGSGMAEKWLKLYRALLRGYDDTAHLTEAEKKALPYVVYSIQLICVGYFSGQEQFEQLAQTNQAMLRFLLENRNALEF